MTGACSSPVPSSAVSASGFALVTRRDFGRGGAGAPSSCVRSASLSSSPPDAAAATPFFFALFVFGACADVANEYQEANKEQRETYDFLLLVWY